MKYDYTVKELKQAEIDCLTLLEYRMTNHSSLFCLDYLLSLGIIWEHENFNGDLDEMHSLSYKILDFFIEDVRYVDFNPFQVSCAVVSLARDFFKLKEPWSTLSAKVLESKMDEFMNCFIVIKR
jgi:hypothetical protein